MLVPMAKHSTLDTLIYTLIPAAIKTHMAHGIQVLQRQEKSMNVKYMLALFFLFSYPPHPFRTVFKDRAKLKLRIVQPERKCHFNWNERAIQLKFISSWHPQFHFAFIVITGSMKGIAEDM